MICPHCGEETPDSSKYCVNCGTKLQQNSSAEESPAYGPSTAEETSVPDEKPQTEARPAPTSHKPGQRRRQRRRLIDTSAASPAPRPVQERPAAEDLPDAPPPKPREEQDDQKQESLGDTIRYEAVSPRRDAAEAAKEMSAGETRTGRTTRAESSKKPEVTSSESKDNASSGSKSRSETKSRSDKHHEEEKSPSDEKEQSSEEAADASVQAEKPAEEQDSESVPNERGDEAVPEAEDASRETEQKSEEEPTEPKSEDEDIPHTRAERKKRGRKFSTKLIVILVACIVAAAAIIIWQWSINTPRARLTQALRDGDIIRACEIYDTELREEGLTANEVYYLCAAAEKIADDFEADETGESYEGRLLLLDALGNLPYRDVQDAVAEARKRIEARHSVLGLVGEAGADERRGDLTAAIAEYEEALSEKPGDEKLTAEIKRLEDAYRAHALETADQYVAAGNIAQARMVLLRAMLEKRFASDPLLMARLQEITNEQIQAEGMSGAARNALDMSRLGQAAFLMESVTEIPSATAHLTPDDLMGVLTGLYNWRNYNASPIAGTDPVLSVIRDALPVRTESAQWPHRVAAEPVQLLCDALFGQRAENVNLAEALGPQLFGSYKYEDGYYYFASMTAPKTSISYADPSPLPHMEDNAYLFYCESSNRNENRLYEMEIRPTMTSPFGFTVSSVKTIAEGRDAETEAAPALSSQEAQETPTPAVSVAVPDDNTEYPEQVPELVYAPDGSLTGGMVFPDSDMRLLTDADLAALSNTYSDVTAALDLARNEIYARRGHLFSNPDYQNYFSQFAWYSPSHAVSESEFNEYERQNLQQILAWENGY